MIHHRNLSENDRDSIHQLIKTIYLDGECYAFAIALHRNLGWPMHALKVGRILRHVAVRGPDGYFYDARGRFEDAVFAKPFANVGKSYSIVPVSEGQLYDKRPISDLSIDRASGMAQIIWPDLPWLTSTFRQRSLLFLKELESLCRKHGVWIRSSLPTSGIIIDESHGDEGFQIQLALTGQYFFDRVIERTN